SAVVVSDVGADPSGVSGGREAGASEARDESLGAPAGVSVVSALFATLGGGTSSSAAPAGAAAGVSAGVFASALDELGADVRESFIEANTSGRSSGRMG